MCLYFKVGVKFVGVVYYDVVVGLDVVVDFDYVGVVGVGGYIGMFYVLVGFDLVYEGVVVDLDYGDFWNY